MTDTKTERLVSGYAKNLLWPPRLTPTDMHTWVHHEIGRLGFKLENWKLDHLYTHRGVIRLPPKFDERTQWSRTLSLAHELGHASIEKRVGSTLLGLRYFGGTRHRLAVETVAHMQAAIVFACQGGSEAQLDLYIKARTRSLRSCKYGLQIFKDDAMLKFVTHYMRQAARNTGYL